jgi:hypothetical protein
MDHLSWPYIAAMVIVPPIVSFPVAKLLWRRNEVMLGSVAGGGIIFIVTFALVFREYAYLEQLGQACQNAGRVCIPDPSGFIRYAIYGFIGLFQLFWLFAAGLKYEQRESEKHYDAEWRRR